MPRRLIPDGNSGGLFHVISRVVDRRLIFGGDECRQFLKLARGHAAFGGLELITWCVMGNHFHLLVRIPPGSISTSQSLNEAQILSRMEHIYRKREMDEFRAVLARVRTPAERAAFLDPFRKRMGSLPEMMKGIKQRFSRWYNLCNSRCGTLWEARYHCVVIQSPNREGEPLGPLASVVAAYIDLNPVRAGLAATAESHPWSGFSAACGENKTAIAGILRLHGLRPGMKPATALNWQRELLNREREKMSARGVLPLPTGGGQTRHLSQAKALGDAAFIHCLAGNTPSGRKRQGRPIRSRSGRSSDPICAYGWQQRTADSG